MQYDSQSTCSSDYGEKRPFFNRKLDSILNGKPGKMFVGGLNPETSVETLRFHFGQYGFIEDCVIMRDTKTKLSRGFGFVTFEDPACIQKVLDEKEHILDGKKIDPQPAIRSISPARSVHNIFKKIFVGGVSQKTTVEDLKSYFQANFGPVEDLVLKVDFPKNNHRGFGFLTFEDSAIADRVCNVRYHTINGKTVETKYAQKKEFVNLTPISTTNLVSTAPSSPDSIFSFCGMEMNQYNSGFMSAPPTFSYESSSFQKRLAEKYMSRAPSHIFY